MGERVGIGALVAAALLVRIFFALTIPPLQAPDERAHLHYVSHLREHRALPVHPQERSLEMWGDPLAQAYQPPLAYLLFAPVEHAFAAAGAKATARLRAVRIQNAFYGAGAVLVGALVAARLTRRGDPRRVLTAAVLAFLPGFVAVGSAVNNDSLANLLAASLWLALVPGEGRERAAWKSGLVLGAACLTKLSSLALAPLLFLVPWMQRRRDPLGALRFACVASAIAGLLLLPWMLRNLALYGDLLAIGVGSVPFEWLATVLSADQLEAASRPRLDNVFFQFWGRFGVANNLAWSGVPLAFGALALAALAGWLRPRASGSSDVLERWAATFALAPLLALAGLAHFSWSYAGAWQGRYLYGALLPIALLLACGWARWIPERRRAASLLPLAIALALLAVDVAVGFELARFFADTPPDRWVVFTRL